METMTKPTEESTQELASEQLLAELMSIALDELKLGNEPWQRLSQNAQDDAIERVEKRCKAAVQQTVHLISSRGFVRMPATLDQLVAKDGLKATLSLNKLDPHRHELLDAQGSVITLVLASASQFIDAPHGHKSTPEQPELFHDALDRMLGLPDKKEPGKGEGDSAETGGAA